MGYWPDARLRAWPKVGYNHLPTLRRANQEWRACPASYIQTSDGTEAVGDKRRVGLFTGLTYRQQVGDTPTGQVQH